MRALTIQMPDDLHSAAKSVARRYGTSISQLFRDGLFAHLNLIAEKEVATQRRTTISRQKTRFPIRKRVLGCLRLDWDTSAGEIARLVGISRRRVDSALQYLIREGLAVKVRDGVYRLTRKALRQHHS